MIASSAIKVAAGHYVDLLNPDPATLDIESIAASLSKLCRFTGHTPVFYSVAEHSVHAARFCAGMGHGDEVVRSVFLHDAAEAYIGDVSRPLRRLISGYDRIEEAFEKALEKRFDVDFVKHAKVIRQIDLIMLGWEKREMWPEDSTEWPLFHDEKHDANYSLRKLPLEYLTPPEAEEEFLDVAKILKLS